MSRWWPEELHIALAPERVLLARAPFGMRRRTVECEALACAPDVGATPWAPAVTALEQALARSRWRRASARVVLSDRFVRYGLLPWSEAIAGPHELELAAAAQLRMVHGERVDGWVLRVDGGGYGSAFLVAAVDRQLIDRIKQLAAAARLRLRALEPRFAAAYRRCRGKLRGEAVWFVVLDAERVSVAYLDGAGLRGFHSVRVTQDPVAELEALIQRWALLEEGIGTDAPVYWYAPGEPAESQRRTRLTLRSLDAGMDGGCARLALTGAP